MPLSETYHTGLPLLAALQLLPLAAAAVCWQFRGRTAMWAFSLAAAMAELLLAFALYRAYDPANPAFQFAERLPLVGPIAYHAGADGITVLFVLLAAFLTLLVLVYGRVREFADEGPFFAVVFFTQTALMSLLVTLDLLWFVLMSAVQLFPVGYLLWRWATSPAKDLALARFWQFMGTGVALLLAGALMLAWNHADVTGQGWTFDLLRLSGVKVAPAISSAVFFLLFYGLAIRTPLFPLHGWLPMLAEHGNIALAPVFLLGLKAGIYGMLRFMFPLTPEAVVQWQPFVVAFAAAGIFYAALLALLQENIRRLLAFAVVSHTSVLVIGLFSLGAASFQGAILLSVNFGLGITGLLMMSGMVYHRTHNMQLSRLGGLFDRLPLIGLTFLGAGLSIVGMPGTPGFDAVHLVLEDAMHRFGALVTIAAALGNVVAAGFLLWAFQRAFLAPATGRKVEVEPATPAESFIAVALLLVLLVTGFHSEPWLRLIETPARSLAGLFGTGNA